jgi:hypothetical protein
MKRTILTALISSAMTLMLFGGNRTPEAIQPAQVVAQAATAKSDLITKMRQDVQLVTGGYESFRGHREELLARNFTFVDGDFSGANAGITATVFNQAMTDFEDLRNKTYNGGTISVGVVNNVYKIR